MKLVELPVSDGAVYVNPELVRMVLPGRGHAATLYFDKQQKVRVAVSATVKPWGTRQFAASTIAPASPRRADCKRTECRDLIISDAWRGTCSSRTLSPWAGRTRLPALGRQ